MVDALLRPAYRQPDNRHLSLASVRLRRGRGSLGMCGSVLLLHRFRAHIQSRKVDESARDRRGLRSHPRGPLFD